VEGPIDHAIKQVDWLPHTEPSNRQFGCLSKLVLSGFGPEVSLSLWENVRLGLRLIHFV